jgi:hypothetical protein
MGLCTYTNTYEHGTSVRHLCLRRIVCLDIYLYCKMLGKELVITQQTLG